jgi:hypothetical protein
MLKAGIIDPTSNTCCIRKCCISCRNDFNHWMLWLTSKRKTQVAVQWVAVCQEWCKIKETLYKSVSFNNGTDFLFYTTQPL